MIGVRIRASEVDLPLSDRSKVRIGRAVANALANQQRSMLTLRRAVDLVPRQRGTQGFTEEAVIARVTLVVQTMAFARGRTERSLISGKARWQELNEYVTEWIALARPQGLTAEGQTQS